MIMVPLPAMHNVQMAFATLSPGCSAQPQPPATAPYGVDESIYTQSSQANAAVPAKWVELHNAEATTDAEANSTISTCGRSSSPSSGGQRARPILFGGALDAGNSRFQDAARRIRLGRGLHAERSTYSALNLDIVHRSPVAPRCRSGEPLRVDLKECLAAEVAKRRAALAVKGGKSFHMNTCASSDKTSAPNSDEEVSDSSPSSFTCLSSPVGGHCMPAPTSASFQSLSLGHPATQTTQQPDETTAKTVAVRSFLLGYRGLSERPSNGTVKLRTAPTLELRPTLTTPPSPMSRQHTIPSSPAMSRQPTIPSSPMNRQLTAETLSSPRGRPSLPSPSEKAYRVRAHPPDRLGDFGRNMRSLLNKVCPENVATVAEKVSAVKIQTPEELHCMIQLLFKKALAEPHYCETYADLVFALKSAFQEFPSPEGGKPVTFRSSLLSTVQAEFEDLHAAGADAEVHPDRQELEQARKCRALANMKFMGHLFLRHLLPVRVVSSLVRALLLCDDKEKVPSVVAVECACELLMAVGYTLEASALPIAQQALQESCNRLSSLKREGGYSKRIQFAIQDVLDTRRAGWTRKLFKSSAKTMEEVRLEQRRDLSSQGASSPGVERVIAGMRPTYLTARA